VNVAIAGFHNFDIESMWGNYTAPYNFNIIS